MAYISDSDHPEFDNNSQWPRRLLHVPTMTSCKWEPGNKYKEQHEPAYNAISYTWGRWKLDNASEMPEVGSLPIKGTPWEIPRIKPSHFTVKEFKNAIRQGVQDTPYLKKSLLKRVNEFIHKIHKQRPQISEFRECPEFLWLDVACIDQRGTSEGKNEVGRQARIFRGAETCYIWLSRTTNAVMVQALDSLKNKIEPDLFQGHKASSIARAWMKQAPEIHTAIFKIVSDPWFTSLWTLQEAFLHRSAIVILKDVRNVPELRWPLKMTSLIVQFYNIQRTAKRALILIDSTSEYDASSWQHTKDVVAIIEASGFQSLHNGSPMGALAAAQFRTTIKEVDRVYGIMQVFGDEFSVGEAANSPQQRSHDYTLSELQDEFGRLLLHRYPILSQIHIHTEAPPLGKGWRVCERSAIPGRIQFARNYQDHDTTKHFKPGLHVTSRCKLTTTTFCGSTWGYFTGKACDFDILQRLWNAHYYLPPDSGRGYIRPGRVTIALDNLPDLQQIMPAYARSNEDWEIAANLECQLAQEISSHFQGASRKMQLVVLLLGEKLGLERPIIRTDDLFFGIDPYLQGTGRYRYAVLAENRYCPMVES